MNLASLRKKLGSESFPALSERLRGLIDFALAVDEQARQAGAINRVEVSLNGEVHAWGHDRQVFFLGKEADICLQLRRLAGAAGLDRVERSNYERLLFERAGLILSPRHGCHTE